MSDVAIRVEGLGKQYRLGGTREQYSTLRDQFRKWTSLRCLLQRANSAEHSPSFWALKDVSFEVKQGECVGIIGRNGAGKSTLLKILSRITEPSSGEVALRGRVSSLLEVGTGFHPELTGRENIFLNGAILGMPRSEIVSKLEEIVAFSEVEMFLDTPMKHYSSGMYMRLAFAVAAHLEPDILIVDEVLAVGDAQFQKKCLGKLDDVIKGGRTVLFVSHNMSAIQNLCSRSLLLEHGHLSWDGTTGEAIRLYLASNSRSDGQFNPAGRRGVATSAVIINAWLERDGIPASTILFGDRVDLFIDINIMDPIRFAVELLLRQQDGLAIAFCPSGLALGWHVEADSGRVRIRCRLNQLHLARGRYNIDLMLADSGVRFFDYVESGLGFTVESAAVGDRNWGFDQGHGQGCLLWDIGFDLVSVGSEPATLRPEA